MTFLGSVAPAPARRAPSLGDMLSSEGDVQLANATVVVAIRARRFGRRPAGDADRLGPSWDCARRWSHGHERRVGKAPRSFRAEAIIEYLGGAEVFEFARRRTCVGAPWHGQPMARRPPGGRAPVGPSTIPSRVVRATIARPTVDEPRRVQSTYFGSMPSRASPRRGDPSGPSVSVGRAFSATSEPSITETMNSAGARGKRRRALRPCCFLSKWAVR